MGSGDSDVKDSCPRCGGKVSRIFNIRYIHTYTNICFSTPPSYDGRGATYDG